MQTQHNETRENKQKNPINASDSTIEQNKSNYCFFQFQKDPCQTNNNNKTKQRGKKSGSKVSD